MSARHILAAFSLFACSCTGVLDPKLAGDLDKQLTEFNENLEGAGRDLSDALPGGLFTRLLREASDEDPKVRARAVAQVERLFKVDLAGSEPAFEVTARFAGFSSSGIRADLFYAPFPRKVYLERYLESRSLNLAAVPAGPSRADRAKVVARRKEELSKSAQSTFDYFEYFLYRLAYEASKAEHPGGHPNNNEATRKACAKIGGRGRCNFTPELANARRSFAEAMSDAGFVYEKQYKLPPDGPKLTEEWGLSSADPILFLVIPKSDIDENANLKIRTSLHVAGDSSRHAGQGRWHEIPGDAKCRDGVVDSGIASIGELCLITYNLLGTDVVSKQSLDDLRAALSEIEALRSRE